MDALLVFALLMAALFVAYLIGYTMGARYERKKWRVTRSAFW